MCGHESKIIEEKYRTIFLFDISLDNTICKNCIISDFKDSVIDKTFENIESWNLLLIDYINLNNNLYELCTSMINRNTDFNCMANIGATYSYSKPILFNDTTIIT